MSTATVPQFQLHHRLALALEASGVEPADMAEDLGVHVNSIHNWMGGRTNPKLGMIKLWALRTGVPYTWILDGVEPGDSPEQVKRPDRWTVPSLKISSNYLLAA